MMAVNSLFAALIGFFAGPDGSLRVLHAADIPVISGAGSKSLTAKVTSNWFAANSPFVVGDTALLFNPYTDTAPTLLFVIGDSVILNLMKGGVTRSSCHPDNGVPIQPGFYRFSSETNRSPMAFLDLLSWSTYERPGTKWWFSRAYDSTGRCIRWKGKDEDVRPLRWFYLVNVKFEGDGIGCPYVMLTKSEPVKRRHFFHIPGPDYK